MGRRAIGSGVQSEINAVGSQSAECWNLVSRVRFKIFAGGPCMLTGSAADGVYRDSIMDELRRIELAVVEGE